MTKAEMIVQALKKIGINTPDELNAAIKEQKPLNIGIMTAQLPGSEEKAG